VALVKGKPLVARGKLDVLHEVVRRAYKEAQSHEHGDPILGLAEGFRPFAQQKLLPETRLLLSLLPDRRGKTDRESLPRLGSAS